MLCKKFGFHLTETPQGDGIGKVLIPVCIQDGDRGGSEEPTQAYPGVRRGEGRSDNEGIRLKANWYNWTTTADLYYHITRENG
jgi:hypothetical protein